MSEPAVTNNMPSGLSANRRFLESRISPATRRALEEAHPETACLQAEARPDGDWNLSWSDGRRTVALHSRRAPRDEARRLAEKLSDPAIDCCLVAGFAGMYHLPAIAARLPRRTLLLVVDLSPDLVRAALPYCRLTELAAYEQSCIFIVNSDLVAIVREFRRTIAGLPQCRVTALLHPSARRLAPNAYRRLLDELAAEVELEECDRATRNAAAAAWSTNARANLPAILTAPDPNLLRHRFSGATALVAAAGPGLNAALPLIRRRRREVLLIAVGTAMKPLLAAGIEPDLVVALDSDPQTLQQLPDTVPSRTMLLAAPSVPPEWIGRFAGRTWFFSFSGLGNFNHFLDDIGRAPVILNVGGTVALSAIDAAVMTGCRRLIICGLDLAIAADGATHAVNSMYDRHRIDPGELIPVDGNYHRTVPTTRQFAA
ncbi:MAG: DUF115 domain-containing protein, partial [Victivallales bacterium]|nr:DUF115 domain-containing protein [Victivallales bacterium]